MLKSFLFLKVFIFSALSKANLTALLKAYKYPSPEKELPPDIAYASLKSELLHPSILDMNRLTNLTEISLADYIDKLLNGMIKVHKTHLTQTFTNMHYTCIQKLNT